MADKMSNNVSHMCGYCNKIFEGEHDLDKHIEDIHFLEVLNEEDEEDEEEEAMETVDIDINVDEVNKVSEEDEVDVDINVQNVIEDLEEYEVVDPVDVNLDFEDKFNINLMNEYSSETSKLDCQNELNPNELDKQENDKPLGKLEIKSETNDISDEEIANAEIAEVADIANAEMKKLRKRERERLKKQRRRQRQVESGDIAMIREKDKLKRQGQRQLKRQQLKSTTEQLKPEHIDIKEPINRLGLVSKVPKVAKEGSIPHRDWSPFYRREGDNFRCLGCMEEFGGLRQVHRHLTTSSFCGEGVGLKTESTDTKTTSPVSQSPRRDYQGLYMKGEENTWSCSKCGNNFKSDTGVRMHMKVTTCGFGSREPKPQHERLNYQSMYKMAGEEYVCTNCGMAYKSQHGVHHHLQTTHCGFGTKEARTQKKTSFKSLYRKEGEAYLCNACGSEYKSDGGVHHHLRRTQCGFGAQKTQPKKKMSSKVGSSHICNFCNVGFTSEEAIENHLKMTNCIQLHTAGREGMVAYEKFLLNSTDTKEEGGDETSKVDTVVT